MPNGRTHSASPKGLESQVNCKHFFNFEKNSIYKDRFTTSKIDYYNVAIGKGVRKKNLF